MHGCNPLGIDVIIDPYLFIEVLFVQPEMLQLWACLPKNLVHLRMLETDTIPLVALDTAIARAPRVEETFLLALQTRQVRCHRMR